MSIAPFSHCASVATVTSAAPVVGAGAEAARRPLTRSTSRSASTSTSTIASPTAVFEPPGATTTTTDARSAVTTSRTTAPTVPIPGRARIRDATAMHGAPPQDSALDCGGGRAQPTARLGSHV